MEEMRLINANALHAKICEDSENNYAASLNIAQVLLYIETAPTIEAEPIRHGRWVEVTKHRDENGTILTDYECNECFHAILKSEIQEIISLKD